MHKSKYSISPITAAITAALYPFSSVVAQDAEAPESEDYTLEEVIVTATKREANVQVIPSSVQALTQENLATIGARTMEDFTRFVPSVNVVSYGAGQSVVVFRGAITSSSFLAQATSSVYLDEMSVTQTGDQPDIRAVDVERVEALAGPQGTLYGSDAQAGTLRILTNQPVMNEYEAVFDGELRGGSDSDMSYRASVVFNFPLIEDKLALRLVGFNDRDGGFIDNVYGHTPDTYPINGNPGQLGTLDNAASVEKNWNEDDIYGGRVHLLWQMNDNWSATGSIHYQNTESGANDSYDPFVGDLQDVRFHKDFTEEEFSMYSLKVEGDLGFAQLVGAVSYFDRELNEVRDVTAYTHYWAAYSCHDSAYTSTDMPYYFANPDTDHIMWWPVYCNGPTADGDWLSIYHEPLAADRLTVEVRLSHSGDVFDWIVGGFYEDSTDEWTSSFNIPTGTEGGHIRDTYAASNYSNSLSRQFIEHYYGGDWGDATTPWSSGQVGKWEQKAVFGEFTWHISDAWDLTVGGRYFDRNNDSRYWLNKPGREHYWEGRIANDYEYREAHNGEPMPRKGEESQFLPKASLAYHFGKDNNDKMLYALYSEGARQGGVNRVRGDPFFPDSYDSDLMKNHELGYKSSFADGKGRLNLTYYHMLWEDYQLWTIDPASSKCIDPDTGEEVPSSQISIPGVCGQPWQTLIANLGEASITGFNVALDYTPNENWLLGFNYEPMTAETESNHDLNGNGEYDLVKGQRLPLVPDYKASAWVEYHRPTNWLGADNFFIRLQWSFTGDAINKIDDVPLTDPNPQFTMPSYDIGDLRAGLVGDNWQVDVFINNLTDERALYMIDGGDYFWAMAQSAEGRPHLQRVWTNRPREFGVRYTKRWGD